MLHFESKLTLFLYMQKVSAYYIVIEEQTSLKLLICINSIKFTIVKKRRTGTSQSCTPSLNYK